MPLLSSNSPLVASATLWRQDAFWPGRAIAERLRTELATDLRLVELADDRDPEAGAPKQWPAALVMLERIVPTDVGPAVPATAARMEQRWLVVLAGRVARAEPGKAAGLFGPLVPKVVRALHAWQPAGVQQRFAWAPGPRPDYGRDMSYLPLVFAINVTGA